MVGRRKLARRKIVAALAGVAALAAMAVPHPAAAQWHRGWGWRGGVWIGLPPVVVAPPVYVPPPVYYPPPSVYYAPPPVYYQAPATPAGAGRTCYAPTTSCSLPATGPLGSPCSCPYGPGSVGGRIGA